ncbi:MAG: DUF4382 domain-containing protein [Thermoplasmatales archaeon]|nr:DUF4382 domain-containing protein [Thermoplasmatales archaeon]
MKMKIFVACAIVGSLVLASGCVEQETTEDETTVDMSSVTFQVTDKVTDDFDHVNVTFSEIKIHKEIEGDNKSWVVVTSESKTVDLVALNLSHINETLGVAEIEAGNYSKLWINVSKCVGVLSSTGVTVNITVPSGWLKIQQLHLFNFSKGNHTITIDIDLEGSIHTFHGGEEYKFIPVISSMNHQHEKKSKQHWKEHEEIKNMVGNRAPAIDILVNDTLVKKNAWVNADEDVEFNASATLDIEGDDINYTWDFDDGTTADGSVVNHSFSDLKNVYKVTLTVTDGTDEAIAIITINVHVSN